MHISKYNLVAALRVLVLIFREEENQKGQVNEKDLNFIVSFLRENCIVEPEKPKLTVIDGELTPPPIPPDVA